MGSAIYYFRNPVAPEPNHPPRFGSAIVIWADGKILLEHRSDNFKWGLVSGDIRSDETFAACAVRKTLSETGIGISAKQLHEMKLYDDPSRIVSFVEGNVYRVVSMAYYVDLFAIPETVPNEKSIELRWVDPRELDQYEIILTHQDILEDFLKMKCGIEYKFSRTIWKQSN